MSEICDNVRHLQFEQLSQAEYDVVLSVGLFDHLPDDDAQRLLSSWKPSVPRTEW